MSAPPTGVLFNEARAKPLSTTGAIQPGAYYQFYLTQTLTPTNVYADGLLATPLSQTPGSGGTTAASDGRLVPIYLNPATTYRYQLYSATAVLLEDVDPYIPVSVPTQAQIGQVLYPQTALEIAAGAVPVNFAIPSHAAVGYAIVDRYGTNTTPGVTNMSTALQTAITVALATVGSGKSGVGVRFLNGAYNIVSPPTFGGASTNYIPLDIGGAANYGTQLILSNTAGAGSLFNLTGYSGGTIHDLVISGSTLSKNNGIQVGTIGGAQTIEWNIYRIVSFMAGVGIYLADTNTIKIDEFNHWPGSGGTYLQVVPAVTLTDISHGIYCTGGFVHNTSITRASVTPGSNFAPGSCGIKVDCNASDQLSIRDVLCQTRSGTNTEIGINIATIGSVQSLTMDGVYCEGTSIILSSVSASSISNITDGGVGGTLTILSGTRENSFKGIGIGVCTISDSTCFGNTFEGVNIRGADAWSSAIAYIPSRQVTQGGVTYTCILANTNQVPPNATFWVASSSFTDGSDAINQSTQPNAWIGVSYPGFSNGVASRGLKWRKLLPWAATISPDAYNANTNVIRATVSALGAATTVNAPLHPYNGQEVEFTLRNESTGALGAWTWGFLTPASVPLPANGFNRSYTIQYDSDFGNWRMKYWSPADVAN